MSDQIEVFSDMVLRGPPQKKAELRQALIRAAAAPWWFEPERSEEIRRHATGAEDVLVFRREGSDLPHAGLTLWERPDGYYVPNIVPLKSRELSRSDYNAILNDFVGRLARDIAEPLGFSVELTAGAQTLEDWTSAEAAAALRRFSAAANKSTGASHPLDEQRWFAFLLAAHRAKGSLDPDRLARWLQQIEGWDEDTAHRLSGEYERALALLAYADAH